MAADDSETAFVPLLGGDALGVGFIVPSFPTVYTATFAPLWKGRTKTRFLPEILRPLWKWSKSSAQGIYHYPKSRKVQTAKSEVTLLPK